MSKSLSPTVAVLVFVACFAVPSSGMQALTERQLLDIKGKHIQGDCYETRCDYFSYISQTCLDRDCDIILGADFCLEQHPYPELTWIKCGDNPNAPHKCCYDETWFMNCGWRKTGEKVGNDCPSGCDQGPFSACIVNWCLEGQPCE